MKKILYLTFLLVGMTAHSQYYVTPNIGANTNPGGLLTLDEQPLIAYTNAGFTAAIQSATASPTWSTAINIPFNFEFNGQVESQFIISSSGVMTFDVTTALVAPSSTRGSLPSAAIPDKSICAWGLNCAGANDGVAYGILGTAPNRQMVAVYASVGYGPLVSPAQSWTYWGFIIEETTNNIYVVDMRTNGFTAADTKVAMGVQIDANTAIVYNGNSEVSNIAGEDPSPGNNTYYSFIPGSQPQYDLSISNFNMPNYVAVGNQTISGDIVNLGSETVTSLTINYEIDGGTAVSEVLTGLSIAPFQTSTFNHSTAWAATIGTFDIDVYASDINGVNADENTTNDVASDQVSVLSQIVSRAIVIEEGTGTWCGWCPRGAVAMEYMYATYPGDQFIGIAVHNGDPMTVSAYDAGTALSGFPGCNVNRSLKGASVSQATFEQYYQDRLNDVSPMSVNLTPSASGSSISLEMTSTFYTNMNNANMRMGVIIIEDSVTGTSSQYDQVNYYSSQSQNIDLFDLAGNNWKNMPNPVLASNMVYDHVGLALLGGYAGQANSIPTTIIDGQTVNYTFNYTVPAASDLSKMHAVGVVIDQGTGEILQAKQIRLDGSELGISEENKIDITVFPNPASDVVNMNFDAKGGDYSIAIMDMTGKVVKTVSYKNLVGVQNLAIDVANLKPGAYLINLATDGISFTNALNIK
jgi:hypothetical protein